MTANQHAKCSRRLKKPDHGLDLLKAILRISERQWYSTSVYSQMVGFGIQLLGNRNPPDYDRPGMDQRGDRDRDNFNFQELIAAA